MKFYQYFGVTSFFGFGIFIFNSWYSGQLQIEVLSILLISIAISVTANILRIYIDKT
ncbi:hypothetical protein [Thalassotalea hakodatensis]|uniref:hypothetical protein n=1 Tax=Thalassotalea hakodatensis TaxID=3030492 RepID=UPI00257295BA|nr:hypothetical protein [Thalassotalea hakodatensis]